ncbi:MAG: hypothetical protein N2040_00205 [Caldimonas manganoxidans]|nr:hypothetical protein [Caldimonas manganoxidans]
MTIDELIIKLAREAGLGESLTHNGGEHRVWIEGADWHDELTRFATLIRNEALEEAAGVCIETGSTKGSCDAAFDIADACAAAIRAMKEQP